MNELEKSKNAEWLVSDPVSKMLVKNKNLLFSNLSKRMTVAQNILFSLALLHVEVGEDYAEATFYREDVERFIDKLKYKKSYKERILADVEAVGSSSIIMFDEKMIDDPKNGKMKGILIFSDFSYEVGKYHFTFNSSKTNWSGERITPILDILKRKDTNPVVYSLDTFSKLSVGGQILYELLLLASSEGKRSLTFDLEGLRGVFNASGKSMEKFNGIKNKHLLPAIESINNETELNVDFEIIKRSRTIIGVTIRWSYRKVKLPVTDQQIALANELYVELLEFYKDHELLERLKHIEDEYRGEASDLIAEAIELKSETKKQAKLLAEAIENKQNAEQVKAQIKEQENTPVAVTAIIQPQQQLEETEERAELVAFFDKLGKVSKQTKRQISEACAKFKDDELAGLLEYAYSIYLDRGNTLQFLAKVLKNWEDSGIETVAEAIEYQDTNYKNKTKTKSSKPKESKSNVPKWSNPDYENELSEEFIEKLIEFHRANETLETPKAQAEIAQRRAEIEKKRAELEAKKWELLGRLDTLEEKE